MEAEKTVSRSFLYLWFVMSQSVILVERFVFLAEQNALSCGANVWLCMCGFICVVLIMIIIVIKFNGRQVKLNTLGEVQYTEAKNARTRHSQIQTHTTTRTALTDYTHGHRHMHED